MLSDTDMSIYLQLLFMPCRHLSSCAGDDPSSLDIEYMYIFLTLSLSLGYTCTGIERTLTHAACYAREYLDSAKKVPQS
jgi:hypothetical protein